MKRNTLLQIADYEDALTTQRPTTVGLVTTPGGPSDCLHDGSVFHDGEMVTVDSSQPCEHCYCMRGDIVCAVQDCGTPLKDSDCTPLEPPPGQCCPTTYQCGKFLTFLADSLMQVFTVTFSALPNFWILRKIAKSSVQIS